MAIPTSRTKSSAKIEIDSEKCTGCGQCVHVCKGFNLEITDKKVKVLEDSPLGCIGCGHCMAVCPADAIKISGRTLSSDDMFVLPDRDKKAGYEQLLALLQHRRSIREFKDIPVEKKVIDEIIKAASTAPMGLPPSDVNVMILDSKEKNRAFAEDLCAYLEKIKWIVSGWFLFLMRPFWGKANDELFRSFIKPVFSAYIENMKRGINLISYDAPLVMYFYGSPYSDPADAIITATYAMVAAESLGLGSCMIGGVHHLIQTGSKARDFRKKYGIKHKSWEGIFIIFGYSDVKYSKGINRTFASVETKE